MPRQSATKTPLNCVRSSPNNTHHCLGRKSLLSRSLRCDMNRLESLQTELDKHERNGDTMYLTVQWYHGKWHADVVVNRTRGNCTWVGPSFDAYGNDMYSVAR